MKYIITERQYRILNEETEEILEIPYKVFNSDWEFLQEYLEKIGNPPFKLIGSVDLRYTEVFDLGKLVGVTGGLVIRESPIHTLGDLEFVGGIFDAVKTLYLKSLGKLRVVGATCIVKNSMVRDLGDLERVGGTLNIYGSRVESLGNLKFINRDLIGDPNSPGKEKMLKQLENIEVNGDVYYLD